MNVVFLIIWIWVAIAFAIFQLPAPWWIVCMMAIVHALQSLQDALDD